MEWILCRNVGSSCLLTHNIATHISSHDLPYNKDHVETRKFSEYESFSVPPAEIRGSTMVLHCPQYLCLFHIVFEWSPSMCDQRKMLVLQIDFFVEYFPHRIKILFLSSQFYVIHIHR